MKTQIIKMTEKVPNSFNFNYKRRSKHFTSEEISTYILLFMLFVSITLIQFAIRGLFPQKKSMRIYYGLVVPLVICSMCLIKDTLCGLLGFYLFKMDFYNVSISSCMVTLLGFIPLIFYTIYDKLFWLYPIISLAIVLLFTALYIYAVDYINYYSDADYVIIAIKVISSFIIYILIQWVTRILSKCFKRDIKGEDQ